VSALGQGITGLKPYGGSGSSFQKGPISGVLSFVRPTLASLTQVTTAGGAFSEPAGAAGPIAWQGPYAASADTALLGQAVSGDFSKTFLIETNMLALNYPACGIYVADGTGKFVAFYNQPVGNGVFLDEWNSPTSYDNTLGNRATISQQPTWFRVNFDGTTFTFSNSANGILFDPVFSELLSSTILGAPTQCGFIISTQGGGAAPPDTLSAYVWNWQ
jgi:hypothetical protein